MEKPNLSLIASAAEPVDEQEPSPDPRAGPAGAPQAPGSAPGAAGPPAQAAQPAAPAQQAQPPRPNGFTLARAQKWAELAAEFRIDLNELLARYPEIARQYTLVTIFDKKTPIGEVELDRIYGALTARNPDHSRDVLLLLLSTGGSVEPAYRISKICKHFARAKFAVCVPRYAKSAATLISLGADEVHMGRLGELGPIDPQVQGLPALAMGRALDALAALAQKYPGSSEMLADYLRMQVRVQQIGHFERVAESTIQYAQRLLSKKYQDGVLPGLPEAIAQRLVHEYKDHGFVIDVEEARELLGKAWILDNSPLTRFGDDFYTLYARYSMYLETTDPDRILLLMGSLHPDDLDATFWPYRIPSRNQNS